MPSQIILDMKDPGVAALAAGWEDGQSYPIPEGTMAQVNKNEDRVILDITELVAPEEGAEQVEDEEAPPTPTKPAVKVKY